MQRVIVLRGTPASGKTTLAKRFRNFEQKVAWLKVDNFKDFFSEDASAALPYVNEAALTTLRYLISKGFSVVIDGVFQDKTAIDDAISICDELQIPIKVFELTVSLETLKKRDLEREGVPEGLRKPLGERTIEDIYNKLKNNPYPNAIELNTEKYSLDECIEIINTSFNS